MSTRVIVPAEPLITPEDVPGSHAADDAAVIAMIAAATSAIDGPTGCIGRCFGEQTLETGVRCWESSIRLPYGPVIEIESVVYLGSDDADIEVDEENWSLSGDYVYFSSSWTNPSASSRPYPIKIRYRAGYNGESVLDGGTGDVPEAAKAAVIEAVQQLILARSDSLGIRSFTVEDIESVTYLDADRVAAIVRNASAGLLSGFREMVL